MTAAENQGRRNKLSWWKWGSKQGTKEGLGRGKRLRERRLNVAVAFAFPRLTEKPRTERRTRFDKGLGRGSGIIRAVPSSEYESTGIGKNCRQTKSRCDRVCPPPAGSVAGYL